MNKESFINEALQHMLHQQTSLVDVINAAIEYGQANANHWISVEDELPKKGDMILALQDTPFGGQHYIACTFMKAYNNSDFHVFSDAYLGITKGGLVEIDSVTHWMPMPTPPFVSKTKNTGKKGE